MSLQSSKSCIKQDDYINVDGDLETTAALPDAAMITDSLNAHARNNTTGIILNMDNFSLYHFFRQTVARML